MTFTATMLSMGGLPVRKESHTYVERADEKAPRNLESSKKGR